jgi:PAS domain S-box-containing protein
MPVDLSTEEGAMNPEIWRHDGLEVCEACLRHLSEAIPDAILVGQDGLNVYVNAAAVHLLGSSCAQELLDHEMAALLDPAGNGLQNMQRLQAGEKSAAVEDRFVRRDGSMVPVEVFASLFMWRSRPALLVIARDLSERKLYHQLMDGAMRELQKSYDQIDHKDIELQESNRTRSEFLAAISHELRTPLNAVIGFSELLKDGLAGSLTEEQCAMMQDINNSGSQLLSLLDNILEFSQINYTQLELCAVDVDQWLMESVLPWRDRAIAKGLTLTLEIPVPLGMLWLDPAKLRQIVVNLLSNAVKFTKAGGSVTLTARRVAQPGALMNSLEIEVKDTGIGFSAAMQKRLFEPFHQDDACLGRHYEGVGLGLALVKRLVALSGGMLKVCNTPDGACVTALLPWRIDPDN